MQFQSTGDNSRKLNKGLLLFVTILVVLAALGGWYIGQNYPSKDEEETSNLKAPAAAPEGWTLYRDERYRLQFIHPKEWGEAQLLEQKGDSGSSYSISFTGSSPKRLITVAFMSTDYVRKICNPSNEVECKQTKPLTKEAVVGRLANKAGLAAHDDSSYAVISTTPRPNQKDFVNALVINHATSLPAIDVSAASIAISLYPTSDSCPKDQFAPDTSSDCITRAIYESASKSIKSLESI